MAFISCRFTPTASGLTLSWRVFVAFLKKSLMHRGTNASPISQLSNTSCNLVWQTVLASIHFCTAPRTLMVNHFAMVRSYQTDRPRRTLCTYRAVQTILVLTFMQLMYFSVLNPGDGHDRCCPGANGSIPLLQYDHLGCLIHWSGPTKMVFSLTPLHVALCYHCMVNMPQRPYMTIRMQPNGWNVFFLSPMYKGKLVVSLIRQKSYQFLRILSTFMVIVSKWSA